MLVHLGWACACVGARFGAVWLAEPDGRSFRLAAAEGLAAATWAPVDRFDDWDGPWRPRLWWRDEPDEAEAA